MKILWTATVALAALAMTGCGDDTPEVCVAREQVLVSVQEVRDYDVVADGVDGLEQRIQQLADDLGALRTAARAEVAGDVEAVTQAVDQTRAAVGAATTAPAKLAALQTGIADVQAALATLSEALPECD